MTVTSLCLGLDVSPRRIGWGLVDLVTGEPVACGCEHLWTTSTRKAEHEAVDWTRQTERTRRAIHRVHSLSSWDGYGRPSKGEIQAVFIEHPISRFAGMAYDEGLAVGVAMAEVQRRWPWVTVQFLKPSEWRNLAGLKGNASKAEVMLRAVRRLYPDIPDPLSQDAADALLIAVAGQRRNGESWDAGQADATACALLTVRRDEEAA